MTDSSSEVSLDVSCKYSDIFGMNGKTERSYGKTERSADPLSALLSSRVRAEVFRLLFMEEDVELHLREIQRRAGLALGTVQQDLAILQSQDLVRSRRDGNRVMFSANKAHPLYAAIVEIVLRTSGVVGVLAKILAEDPNSPGSLGIGTRHYRPSDREDRTWREVGYRSVRRASEKSQQQAACEGLPV